MEIKKINRYVIYLISLFFISLGAAISIKANLGTSPIICLPYVSSLILKMSVGTVCLIFNVIFIAVQIILLRGGFERRQYLQIVVGTIFSLSIDFSMMLVSFLNPANYFEQFALLLVSCVVVAFGVLLEVQTEVVYLPPDRGGIWCFAGGSDRSGLAASGWDNRGHLKGFEKGVSKGKAFF